MKEWAVVAIRYLCADHTGHQEYIAKLKGTQLDPSHKENGKEADKLLRDIRFDPDLQKLVREEREAAER